MATVPTNVSTATNFQTRITVSVCLFVAMILIILVASYWAHSRQPRQIQVPPPPPAAIYTRAARQPRERGIPKSIVDSFPLVVYNALFQNTIVNKEEDEEANICHQQERADIAMEERILSMSYVKSSDNLQLIDVQKSVLFASKSFHKQIKYEPFHADTYSTINALIHGY